MTGQLLLLYIVRLAFSILIHGAGCLTLVWFFGFIFGLLLAMLYFLRTDGRLLALCDHGNRPRLFDQHGQREYVERPGWLFNVKTTTTQQQSIFSLFSTVDAAFLTG